MLFVPGVFANSALWKIQICITAIYVFLVLQIRSFYESLYIYYISRIILTISDMEKICFCQRHALLECLDSCLPTIFSDYYWCRFLQIWYILVKIASRRNVKRKKSIIYTYIQQNVLLHLIFMNRNVIYRALKYVTAVNSNRDTIHLWWTLLQVKTVIYLALNYVTVVSNRGINLPNELAEMNTMLSLRREKAGNSILWSFFSFFLENLQISIE